jgi:Trypsin
LATAGVRPADLTANDGIRPSVTATLVALRRAAVLLLAALAVAAASSPSAAASPRKPFVVGGTAIPIESVPYQVHVRFGEFGCGGSVLDAERILTAAHCVVPPGQTQPRPAESFRVMAGFTDITGGRPPGAQVERVESVRVHPLYAEATKTDDVAVLTLARDLDLSGPSIKPIALAPVWSGPAPGTALGFSGYGAQVEGQTPDGRLYGATLTAIPDDQCRPNIAVEASAGVQCVAAGPQAPCFGDSGGPLTAGGMQVAVASYAPQSGCGSAPAGFADVTAPEVRAFIDGAATVPVAPRQGDPSLLYSVTPPVQGSPMTCAAGTWANAPALAYTFVDDATGAALQSGPSERFVPAKAHRGATVACVVSATNAGGTSTTRTGTTTAVQRDRVPPNSALRSVRCRNRRCTVRLGAGDPNSRGALRVRVTAERRVRARCGKGRKARPCFKTRARRLAVKHIKGTRYRARSSRLPRGETTIRVRVRDAVGNRRRPDLKKRVRIR